MSRPISFSLVFAFSIFAACSSTPEKIETVVVNEAPPRPSLKTVRREPGSLWSEDSRWNDIYAESPSRVLGDTVRIKLSQEIRERISRLADPQKKSDADKVEGAVNQAGAETPSSRAEDRYMEAAVTEVLPRGMFAVRALQTIRVGANETRVELFGNVREKDIDQTDTVVSDNVANLNLNASVGGRPFQPVPILERKASAVATNAAAQAVAPATNAGEKK